MRVCGRACVRAYVCVSVFTLCASLRVVRVQFCHIVLAAPDQTVKTLNCSSHMHERGSLHNIPAGDR